MRWKTRLATVLAISALAMVGAAILLVFSNIAVKSHPELGYNFVADGAFAASYPAVGWLIIHRGRAQRIGWIFLLAGWFSAFELFSEQYAVFGLLTRPGEVPLADVASWVGLWAWMPAQLLLYPALLLFPDGRLPGRRWGAILWALGGVFVLMFPVTFVSVWPYRGADLVAPELPAAIQEALAGPSMIVGFGNMLLVPLALATVIGVIVRFRRSRGIERLQLKWFTSAGIIQVAVLVVTSSFPLPSPLDVIVAILVYPLLPIAVGIAILRYRLYDIDIVIQRTLVYVPLTALLAGIYAASIGISQRLFIAVTGNSSDGAIVLSTLILATTFTPIKNALQGRVDRGFREAQDAERRLLAFTRAVGDDWAVPDPTRTMRAFLAVAVAAVRAGGGAAFLATGEAELMVGESPPWSGVAAVEVAVEYAGHRFGRIALDGPADRGPYSAGDLAALRLAGEQLAEALRGVDHRPPVAASTLAEQPAPSATDSGE
jgi:hypothetical protein